MLISSLTCTEDGTTGAGCVQNHDEIDCCANVVVPCLSAGCHCPEVQGDTWPLVLRMSRMYISPCRLSPRSMPSRSYTFIFADPVTDRNASPAGNRQKTLNMQQTAYETLQREATCSCSRIHTSKQCLSTSASSQAWNELPLRAW